MPLTQQFHGAPWSLRMWYGFGHCLGQQGMHDSWPQALCQSLGLTSSFGGPVLQKVSTCFKGSPWPFFSCSWGSGWWRVSWVEKIDNFIWTATVWMMLNVNVSIHRSMVICSNIWVCVFSPLSNNIPSDRNPITHWWVMVFLRILPLSLPQNMYIH